MWWASAISRGSTGAVVINPFMVALKESIAGGPCQGCLRLDR